MPDLATETVAASRQDSHIQPESRFRRNVVRIATGAIVSQAIVIGATPLLTRLYKPEDFGALAVFTALHAITAGLFTLKYDLSVILPRENAKALDLAALTVSISLLFSFSLLAILGGSRFLFGIPADWYYFLLPLSAILGAAYTCAQQWGARKSDYRRYAQSQVVNSIASVSAGLLLATLAAGLIGNLVLGYVIGIASGLVYISLGFVRARPSDGWDCSPSLAKLIHAAKEYKHFPLFVLPSTLIATLSLSAQPFLLQAMFSLREVGYYAIASRFLLVPAALIGGAVNEAFRAEFVDKLRRRIEVTGFFRRTLGKLLLFALPVFGTFFLIAPPLFSIVLGTQYTNSGMLSRYLCLGVLAQFISQPFAYVFVATGNVKRGLLVQTAVTTLPLMGIVLGGFSGRIEQALALASVLTAAVSAIMIALAFRCCTESDRRAVTGEG